jgi:pyridoxamine 5'-phosphate oxidase
VPRPSYWKGYCVYPEQIEFWINGENRLHDRFLFTRENSGWKTIRLYP